MPNREQRIIEEFGRRPGTGRVEEYVGDQLRRRRIFEGIGGRQPQTLRPSQVPQQVLTLFPGLEEQQGTDWSLYTPGEKQRILKKADEAAMVFGGTSAQHLKNVIWYDTVLGQTDDYIEEYIPELVEKYKEADVPIPQHIQGKYGQLINYFQMPAYRRR